MAKKKTTRRAGVKHLHKKAHVITWVVFLALFLGLAGGYLIAKAKYVNKIGVISIMFNQKDSELNELKAKMEETKATQQNVGF